MNSDLQLHVETDNIERQPVKVLHSLNAIRVICESLVVSHHIYADSGNNDNFVHSYGISNCLMSFFFVLSGFVSMYTTNGKDKSYFMRRIQKTYPFYILMWIAGLPTTILGALYHNKCVVQTGIYTALQPLCLEVFLGWQVDGSNIPAWYYTVLVFLWLIHSNCDLKYWIYDHPLKFMVLFYVISVAFSVLFFYFDRESVKQLPLFRILEFFMGGAAAISFKKGYMMSGKIAGFLFVIYCVFTVFTTSEPSYWADDIWHNGTCTFWKQYDEFKFRPNGLITITSVIWAIIIHWLACCECSGEYNVVMNVLRYDFFKSLSMFSLQLYLSHWVTTTTILYRVLVELGIFHWFSKEFRMLFAYVSSYWLYVYVQPQLDKCVSRIKS
jgi:hypothetical protein